MIQLKRCTRVLCEKEGRLGHLQYSFYQVNKLKLSDKKIRYYCVIDINVIYMVPLKNIVAVKRQLIGNLNTLTLIGLKFIILIQQDFVI